MLCTRGFSVCCDTARSASFERRPARTRVASCRVKSARSAGEMRLRLPKALCCFDSLCVISANRHRQELTLAQQLPDVPWGIAFENSLALPAAGLEGGVLERAHNGA